MSSPEIDEVLFAYIVVASYAVSLVLIQDNNCVQKLVYYVSKSLYEAEVCYLPLEKAILAVVHATCKLLHYFQSHDVHEIYTIKFSHIYIFSLIFMLFCN